MKGRYSSQSDPVDYILGITYEIWEEGNVDLIAQYYADDVTVYALDGIAHGAAGMIEGTKAYLNAYPDRLLLGEAVVWSTEPGGYLSSHRIFSPMTNMGETAYGPATGKFVQVRGVADCLVNDGRIVSEWLMRDALPLVRQLDFDVVASANQLAKSINSETLEWMEAEKARIRRSAGNATDGPWIEFATDLIEACFTQPQRLPEFYSHYAVLHRSPIETHSGLAMVQQYYEGLAAGFSERHVVVDHIAAQPSGETTTDLAIRWCLSGRHTGVYEGLVGTGREIFIMGSNHYRIVNGKVAIEWQTFDGLAVLAQMVR